jgi:hypothetical protein
MSAIHAISSAPARTNRDGAQLAATITREASQQTYYTIRLLVDRDLVADAYRAYAYFRWVDDILDAERGTKTERTTFVERQKAILEMCYRGEWPDANSVEEQMLIDLVRNDREENSGLRSYLFNMMAVMAFDTERRGRIISESELATYSRTLAIAVTDALHYFIGHGNRLPGCETRYEAVYGAHLVHMLRDALEDASAGYFNVSAEFIAGNGVSLPVVDNPAYREWVKRRVQLARDRFRAGREYICQVKNLRCRLAGFAYTARFEWMLRTIVRDDFRLRQDYPERKSLAAFFWMTWMTLVSTIVSPKIGAKLVDFG